MINRSGRFARRAVKVDQALDKIMQHAKRLDDEIVSIDSCIYRRIAKPVYARESMPHFRRSGMDGYAVLSEDAACATPQEPVCLKIIDEVPAGSVSARQVVPGTAIRLMTGAAVPDGADAVVMFEQTEEFQADGQDCVRIKHRTVHGQNITAIGEEIAEGQLLMGAGTRIGPGQVALLASSGYSQIAVIRRPKVGILTTGSELLAPGDPLLPGKVRNSNVFMLAAQIEQYGGAAVRYGTVPDEIEEVDRMIRAALEECDMVLVSGGVSVGDYDVMAEFFTATNGSGLELLFNKIAMRPGSPTTAAAVKDKLVFGLSGNPGACFIGFELLVRPALLAMQGAENPFPSRLQAAMAHDFDKGCPHERYIRGRLSYDANQKLSVCALKQNNSSMLVSIQDANCLIVVPSGSTGAASGQQVDVIPLPYETATYGEEGDVR